MKLLKAPPQALFAQVADEEPKPGEISKEDFTEAKGARSLWTQSSTNNNKSNNRDNNDDMIW